MLRGVTGPTESDGVPEPLAAGVALELLDGWEARVDVPLTGTRRRPFSPQLLAVAHGLAAHTHYIATPALDLIGMGRVLASLPLIRAAYESAITAQWVVQTGDGAAAFVNEDLRQRRNHVTSLEKAASETLRGASAEVAAQLMDELETTSSARRFDEICADLTPGGQDAYVVYRSLSHLSHASVLVADQYLEALEVSPHLALRTEPAEPDAPTWTHILAASLVWAGRAVDILDQNHPRRAALRRAAHALGIQPELQLSARAVVREGARRRP